MGAPDNINAKNCKVIFKGIIKYRKSLTGISHYETIKIRMIYQKMMRQHGYPIRFNEYIDYYSGLGIWVPGGWTISDFYTTYKMWLKDKKHWWRTVKIVNVGEAQEPGRSSIKMIPLAGKWIDQAITNFSQKNYSIYENLGFYDTMNDIFIWSNWDKILTQLTNWGY